MKNFFLKLIDIIYLSIPKKFFLEKKFRQINFGILRGFKIYSSLILSQKLGLYEFKPFLELIKRIKKNSIVINIGSHNGYTLFKIKKYLNSKKLKNKLFSIEANPELIKDQKKTIQENFINEIELINGFLSYNKKKSSMNDYGMYFNNNYVNDNKVKNIDIKKIFTLPQLKKMIFEKIDSDIDEFHNFILIVDIEGYEEEIIDYDFEFIISNFHLVMIEYHSKLILQKLLYKLENVNIGYKIFNRKIFDNTLDSNGHVIIRL